MSEEIYRIFDITIKVITLAAVIITFIQLQEVVRKRHIDMYWKIADMYYSEEQREARGHVEGIKKFVAGLPDSFTGSQDRP